MRKLFFSVLLGTMSLSMFAQSQTVWYVKQTTPTIHHFLLKTFLFSAFAVEKNIIPLHSVKFKWRFAMYCYQKLETFCVTKKINRCSQACGFAIWLHGSSNTLMTDDIKSAILF